MEDGLDLLEKGLAEHSLGLDADTLNAVDDDEGTVSDTKRGRDLRGEVDVAWGVDKVDQVRVVGDANDLLLVVLSVGGGLVGEELGGVEVARDIVVYEKGCEGTGVIEVSRGNSTKPCAREVRKEV